MTVTVARFPSKSVAVGTVQVTLLVAAPGSVATLMSLGQLENDGAFISKKKEELYKLYQINLLF